MRIRRSRTSGDSEEALQDARKNLRNIKSRTDEVKEVASSLRRIRERNHFADQLRVIMEGK